MRWAPDATAMSTNNTRTPLGGFHGTENRARLRSGSADTVRRLRAWRDRPTELSRPGLQVRGRRRDRRDAARSAEPEVRRGAGGAEGRCADRRRVRRVRLPERLWEDARVLRASREGHRKAARRPRDP